MICILGHTPLIWVHRTFSRLHSPFNLVIDPHDLHTGAYPLLCQICLHHYPRHHLALSHLFRSSSCQFSLNFSRPHLYRSVIVMPIQFESGSHLYQSIIHLVNSAWVSGSHLYQSVIVLLVWVCIQFELGPHLYRSIILHVSSAWVFWIAPILISHSSY